MTTDDLKQEKCIAHLHQDPETNHWEVQSLAEHARGVALLASQFASVFGMSSWGQTLGLLHDIGKESNAFQAHIKKESGYDPAARVMGDYQHAFAGGVVARQLYGKSADNYFVNPIVSHHTGLHDTCEIESIAQKAVPPEVNTHVCKTILERPRFKTLAKEDVHHLTRMLYSCLVDADYLDTEAFMGAPSAHLRKGMLPLDKLLPRLERHLQHLESRSPATYVNTIRHEVLHLCQQRAASPVGFYSLTVPTGGGKTLSSLAWAMRHAIKNGQDRIIIAIPYTSIIVQTAAILRDIFGVENVLEHHSNVDPEQIKDSALREKLRRATENWDSPIVVTTNVQLFESMFSNKPSVCRKLHNVANSVILLDEAQTLPMDYLQPIVDTLKTYHKLFHVSVLFTTASQPVLSGLIEGCNPKATFKGIGSVEEIVPSDMKLHERLRRVTLHYDNEAKTYDEVARQLCQHPRVLCVVNTRREARELYERLPEEGLTFHLSKMMCPAHISQTIMAIRHALADDGNTIVRVVSTQLIEAGVDIDFPVVYRQEAGLDSILQAAGRCNREGRSDCGVTHVFSLAKEHTLPKGDMQAANNARLSLGDDRDWFAPATMADYFRQLYCRRDTFDRKDMKQYLYHPNDLSFATAAREFRLIDDVGTPVVVCWERSMELVEKLLSDGPSYNLMRKLAKYMVNVNPTDLKALQAMGAVQEKTEGLIVADYKLQYDEHVGLMTDNQWTDQVLTI